MSSGRSPIRLGPGHRPAIGSDLSGNTSGGVRMLPAAHRDIWTVILCGGKGTRAYPHTLEVPKPLLDVAGRPILRHVMEIYAQQGARRFLLAAGYKIEMIRAFADSLPGAWEVNVVDTGEDANTGTRIWRCRDLLTERFFAAYGDGLGNVVPPVVAESR